MIVFAVFVYFAALLIFDVAFFFGSGRYLGAAGFWDRVYVIIIFLIALCSSIQLCAIDLWSLC